MAKQRRTGQQAKRQAERRTGEAGGGGRTALGLVVVVAVAAGGFLLYRHTTPNQGPERARTEIARQTEPTVVRPPVTREPAEVPAQQPAGAGTRVPAQVAGARRPAPQAPFGESEEVFETGARVYVAHCVSCHGAPGRPAPARRNAVQLWDANTGAVRQLVAQPVGATYEQIADGVAAAKGVPAMAGYRHVLSETQMWDLALLLHNAGQELPDPVLHLLHAAHP